MITKTQLAKKITEKAGLVPFDAQQFFEVFLSRIHSSLSPGEVIGSAATGYFTVRNCIIRSESSISDSLRNNEITAKLILFSEVSDFTKGSRHLHYFGIPKAPDITEDELSAHLNLSISKPQLGEKNLSDEKFFQLKSGSEILKNFISRADILLNTFEKVGNNRADELFVLEISGEISAKLFDEEKNKMQRSELRPAEIDYSDQIEESENDSFSGLPWDFGRKFFEKKVDYPEQDSTLAAQKENELTDEIKAVHNGNIIEEAVREELGIDPLPDNQNKSVDGLDSNEESDNFQSDDSSVIEEKSSKYERVRAFVSSDMKSKQAEEVSLPADFTNKEIESDSGVEAPDEFVPVKSKSEAYHLIDIKKQKKKIFKFSKKSSNDSEEFAYGRDYGKQSWIMSLAISAAVVLILVGLVYIFLEKDSILTSEPKNVFIKVTPPPYVNVIERDYEFAVTFPYLPSENGNQISGIDPEVFAAGVKIVEQIPEPEEPKKVVKETTNTEVKTPEKKAPVITERNKNISKYKDYYVVQVSAYPSYTLAEEEAEKFRDQGYNAFIEIAEIPGKGTWYRIKVGDFTSIKHAEDFLIKNSNQ
jgi:cell division septation protein DedD